MPWSLHKKLGSCCVWYWRTSQEGIAHTLYCSVCPVVISCSTNLLTNSFFDSYMFLELPHCSKGCLREILRKKMRPSGLLSSLSNLRVILKALKAPRTMMSIVMFCEPFSVATRKTAEGCIIICYCLGFRRIHNVLNASAVQVKTQALPRKEGKRTKRREKDKGNSVIYFAYS